MSLLGFGASSILITILRTIIGIMSLSLKRSDSVGSPRDSRCSRTCGRRPRAAGTGRCRRRRRRRRQRRPRRRRCRRPKRRRRLRWRWRWRRRRRRAAAAGWPAGCAAAPRTGSSRRPGTAGGCAAPATRRPAACAPAIDTTLSDRHRGHRAHTFHPLQVTRNGFERIFLWFDRLRVKLRVLRVKCAGLYLR